MNTYLLAEQNRNDIVAHNAELMVTTVKTVGSASYTSYDFHRPEEFKQMTLLVNSPGIDAETESTLSTSVYGKDDDSLVRRIRHMLSFGSTFQGTLANGKAVIVRPDGTLRITNNPDEYGDLLEENTAVEVAKADRYVGRSTNKINKALSVASAKVPQIEQRIADTRQEVHDTLQSRFAQKLALLAG